MNSLVDIFNSFTTFMVLVVIAFVLMYATSKKDNSNHKSSKK